MGHVCPCGICTVTADTVESTVPKLTIAQCPGTSTRSLNTTSVPSGTCTGTVMATSHKTIVRGEGDAVWVGVGLLGRGRGYAAADHEEGLLIEGELAQGQQLE